MRTLEKLLDYGSFEPLYHQLKGTMEEKIELKVWKPCDKISSENELRKAYKISRTCKRRNSERKKGKGTFVAKPKIEQSLTSNYSFSKVTKGRGVNPKDIIF